MPVLLWLSLIFGYGAGIAAAYFLLPKPMLEPFTGRIVLASSVVLAGAVTFLLLRREPPAGPGQEGGLEDQASAPSEADPVRSQAAASDDQNPVFDEESCDDLIGDPAKLQILGARLTDPMARGADGSLSPRELRQILYDGRVDGLIRPSLALPELQEVFRHVVPRLRDRAGERLEPRLYIRTAARCGLISLIDRVFVIRTLQRVDLERQDGETRTVCCNIDGASLTSPVFTGGLLEFLDDHADLSRRLVLELERVPAERAALAGVAHLRAAGIRFCLKRLSAAPIDPQAIRGAGFEFIRLAAPRYAHLPAVADLLPQLAALQAAADQVGLALVVDRADIARTPMATGDLPFASPRLVDELQEDAA